MSTIASPPAVDKLRKRGPKGPLYRKVIPMLWRDDRWRRLSPLKPSGQALYLYLKTGPHTESLPGAFVLGPGAMAEALGWPVRATRRCLDELETAGVVLVDPVTRLVFLPGELADPPASPDVVVGWRKVFNRLPDCVLRQAIEKAIRAYLTDLVARDYSEKFLDWWDKPVREKRRPEDVPEDEDPSAEETQAVPQTVTQPLAQAVTQLSESLRATLHDNSDQ